MANIIFYDLYNVIFNEILNVILNAAVFGVIKKNN